MFRRIFISVIIPKKQRREQFLLRLFTCESHSCDLITLLLINLSVICNSRLDNFSKYQ